jgi:hypothetical protein
MLFTIPTDNANNQILMRIIKISLFVNFQNSVVQCRSLKKKIIMIIHENFEPVKIKYFSLVITYDFLAIFTTVGLFTAFL